MDNDFVFTAVFSEEVQPPVCDKYAALDLQDPSFLNVEIWKLWHTHQQYSSGIKGEKSKLDEVGESLGELLFAMKNILASPVGRGGQWSRFLREQHISRSSADRLVNKFMARHGLEPKLNADAIFPPTEARFQNFVARVLKQCERILPNAHWRFAFIRSLVQGLDLQWECRDGRLIVSDPDVHPEPQEPTQQVLAIIEQPDTELGDVL